MNFKLMILIYAIMMCAGLGKQDLANKIIKWV
jgi:hypothetical protein